MALSLSVVKTIGIHEKKELESFWSHSVLTAMCAKHLGKRFEPLLSPERIWLGAILHDIGKLVYFKFFPEHFNTLKEFSSKNGALFSSGEKHFGFPSSGRMGGILCERWGLPAIVKDACECHDAGDLGDQGGGSRGDFRRIICAANLMAVLASDDLNSDVKQDLFDRLKSHFKMNEKEFLQLMGEVYDLKLDLANYRW
jgi:HD-like signal output (HDOD) protein